jgi:hypothetical protein
MSRKLIISISVLMLAVLACNLPTTSPSSTPVIVPNTAEPSGPTATPLLTDTTLPSAPTTTTAITNTPGDLTLEMLRNGTFLTPYFNRTVTLVNGTFSDGSGATYYSVQMLNTYAFGDLNGDGKNDAAIILAENQGGSGSFESVIGILDQGGTPHQVSQAQLGDRVFVNSVDISSGVIHLDMVVHGPTDPMCCPSLPQKQNFWLISNRLWLMRLTSSIGGTEHVININSPAIWSTVANPFTVTGIMSVLPFENTLAYHIYLTDGTKINESSFTVTPSGGTTGTFSHMFNLGAAGITDWVILQFVDVSAADGSTIALGSVILKTP